VPTPPSSESATPRPAGQQPPEPFGQTGVRQYMGKLFTWVCITLALCAMAMWYRSLSFADRADWRGKDQIVSVRSIYGRLQFSASFFPPGAGQGAGWGYRGGYFRTVQDRWEPSLWKTVGFEVGTGAYETGATGGMWLRAKWYFIAAVFMILPALRGLLGLRRRLREDIE